MMRWKVDHPGWDKKWPDIEKALYDPVLGPKLASLDRGTGQADVYGTLDNIYTHLERTSEKAELEGLRAKVKEAEETKAGLEKDRQGLNRMAYISGTPAAGTDQAMPDFKREDGSPMSSDEMVVESYKRGLLEIDPNDPPKVLRNLKR